jgi:hypothetical protein
MTIVGRPENGVRRLGISNACWAERFMMVLS